MSHASKRTRRDQGAALPDFRFPPAPSYDELLDEIAKQNATNLRAGTKRHREASWELAKALSAAKVSKGDARFSALIEVGAAMAEANVTLSEALLAIERGQKSGRVRRKKSGAWEIIEAEWNRLGALRKPVPERNRVAKIQQKLAEKEIDYSKTQIRNVLYKLGLKKKEKSN